MENQTSIKDTEEEMYSYVSDDDLEEENQGNGNNFKICSLTEYPKKSAKKTNNRILVPS